MQDSPTGDTGARSNSSRSPAHAVKYVRDLCYKMIKVHTAVVMGTPLPHVDKRCILRRTLSSYLKIFFPDRV